jgi:hypothetical protein
MKAKRCKPSRGCAAPGPFTAAQRQKLPPEAYALPLELPGKYPLYKWSGGCLLPSKSHAQAAKARARQQFNRGSLEQRQLRKINQRADSVIRQCRPAKNSPCPRDVKGLKSALRASSGADSLRAMIDSMS